MKLLISMSCWALIIGGEAKTELAARTREAIVSFIVACGDDAGEIDGKIAMLNVLPSEFLVLERQWLIYFCLLASASTKSILRSKVDRRCALAKGSASYAHFRPSGLIGDLLDHERFGRLVLLAGLF